MQTDKVVGNWAPWAALGWQPWGTTLPGARAYRGTFCLQ